MCGVHILCLYTYLKKGMSKMKDDFYNAVHMLLVVDEGLHLTKKQFIQCLIKLMVIYEEGKTWPRKTNV